MPYKIIKKDKGYVVWNIDKKKSKGWHDTLGKAQAQMRLLEGIERGWKPGK